MPDKVKVSVFCGTSLDGFIARRNHDLDFLPTDVSGQELGFDGFLASVDALVMGRNTFDVVRGFGEWPYGSKRVVVLSTRPLDPAPAGAHVERMEGPPAEILARLDADGARHLYVDGGITIQRFLAAGLVTRLVVTRVPVLIGDGIPLFGALPRDVKLRHVKTREIAGGLVQSEYEVAG
jgi:dihydrofolate reductase